MSLCVPIRQRHEPEKTVLYRVLQQHLETFLARVEADETRGSLPRFVVRELRDYLACGILSHGFCRVRCDSCGKDELVAFSCKRRGFCPSCGARRMAETAAHLVDHVLPDVPYRQWVLSLPHHVRFLCAYDHSICAAVRRILMRAIQGHYRRRAEQIGVKAPRIGAVAFEQRFDSALRLNLHFHTIWADGVFLCDPDQERSGFFSLQTLTDHDVEQLARRIRTRVLRLLKRRGKLKNDTGSESSDDPSLLESLGAAAVQGRIPLGPHFGASDPRVGKGSELGKPKPYVPLCANVDGFSLHANVRTPDGSRERLEKLLRYAGRPPIVDERLAMDERGNVIYALRKKWRDGSTHIVLEPLTLIARLAALIPRPFKKLVTYYGVFSSAAGYRASVVPLPDPVPETPAPSLPPPPSLPEAPFFPKKTHTPRKRYSWAELLRRVFLIDVLLCQCGGKRRVLAGITDPDTITKILVHLGLDAEPPAIAPARAPPGGDLAWE